MALSAQSTGQIVHDEGLAAISQTDGWGYATSPGGSVRPCKMFDDRSGVREQAGLQKTAILS